MFCLRGDHAEPSASFCCRASLRALLRALLIPSGRRASFPLPHSPLLALPHCNAARGRVRHGRLAELTTTASPLPRAPSCPSACVSGSTNLSSFSHAPSSSQPRPGGWRTAAAAAACRQRAWPGCHSPSPGHPRQPLCVRRPSGSPPPFLRRRRAFSGRNQRAPAHPLLQNPVKDHAQQFDIREGPFCEAMTHLNSAPEDLFTVV